MYCSFTSILKGEKIDYLRSDLDFFFFLSFDQIEQKISVRIQEILIIISLQYHINNCLIDIVRT